LSTSVPSFRRAALSRGACRRAGTAWNDVRHLVRDPTLAADNNFRRLLLLLDDVDAGSAPDHDAALRLHRVRRTAMVEIGERSLMGFRPARAKSRVVG